MKTIIYESAELKVIPVPQFKQGSFVPQKPLSELVPLHDMLKKYEKYPLNPDNNASRMKNQKLAGENMKLEQDERKQ